MNKKILMLIFSFSTVLHLFGSESTCDLTNATIEQVIAVHRSKFIVHMRTTYWNEKNKHVVDDREALNREIANIVENIDASEEYQSDLEKFKILFLLNKQRAAVAAAKKAQQADSMQSISYRLGCYNKKKQNQ